MFRSGWQYLEIQTCHKVELRRADIQHLATSVKISQVFRDIAREIPFEEEGEILDTGHLMRFLSCMDYLETRLRRYVVHCLGILPYLHLQLLSEIFVRKCPGTYWFLIFSWIS